MTSSRNYIRLRILHIEDDDKIGELVKRAFRFSYIDVQLERAPTLEKGVELLCLSSWDLILLDLSLPDSASHETFARLYSAHPYTPIVILTSEADLEIRAKAVSMGAQDCLDKMELTSPDVLARAVRFAVERHRLLLELREIVRELEEFKRQFNEFVDGDANFSLRRRH